MKTLQPIVKNKCLAAKLVLVDSQPWHFGWYKTWIQDNLDSQILMGWKWFGHRKFSQGIFVSDHSALLCTGCHLLKKCAEQNQFLMLSAVTRPYFISLHIFFNTYTELLSFLLYYWNSFQIIVNTANYCYSFWIIAISNFCHPE